MPRRSKNCKNKKGQANPEKIFPYHLSRFPVFQLTGNIQAKKG
jgi:hypothetical protein